MQITDDTVDSFIVKIVGYLDNNPLVRSPVEGEAYDHFAEFLTTLFEPYSNGERNYN